MKTKILSMTILRSVAKFFGDFVFGFSIALLVFFLSFSQFIKYENIQPLVTGVFEKQIAISIPSQLQGIVFQNITQTCQVTGTQFSTVPLQQGDSIKVNCSDLSGKQSTDLPKILSKAYFDQIYNQKYECSILDCIRNGQGQSKYLVILSEKAYEESNRFVIYSMFGMALGLFLLIISIRTWHGVLKSVGVSSLFVGIFYFIIPLFRGYISNQFPADLASPLMPIVENLFSILKSNLIMPFVVGLILSIIGFGYEFYVKRKAKKS